MLKSSQYFAWLKHGISDIDLYALVYAHVVNLPAFKTLFLDVVLLFQCTICQLFGSGRFSSLAPFYLLYNTTHSFVLTLQLT